MENCNRNTKSTVSATELLSAIYQQDMRRLRKLCAFNVEWFYNNSRIGEQTQQVVRILTQQVCNAKNYKIRYNQTFLQLINTSVLLESGKYELDISRNDIKQTYVYNLQIIYNDDKIVVVKIDEQVKQYPIYEIEVARDEVYFRDEREILYLETMHNHVIWHCIDGEIMERTSFSALEKRLSPNFIRVHRCYILNVFHMKHIQSYEIVMTNGEAVNVSRKRYVGVKKAVEEHVKTK